MTSAAPSGAAPAPLVSIVLPVYNGGAFLAGALDGIRNQTVTDWELIAVDDGSSDDSAACLAAAAAGDPRIRVITHAANRGIGAAYNSGLEAARGRWLAFAEQDDRSLPGRLAAQIAAAEAHGVPIVSARVGLLDADGAVRGAWPDDPGVPAVLTAPGRRPAESILVAHVAIANATLVFDRAAIGADELRCDAAFRRCCQDADLLMRLLRRHPSVLLREVMVHQRRHPGHASATGDPAAMLPDMRRLLARHRPLLFANAPLPAALDTWRRAWSTQYHFEAVIGRNTPRGWGLLLLSALLWPGNPRLRATLERRLGGGRSGPPGKT
jgi:hypothetical protein